ncbi:hypothetical protein K458DRAFT_201326 [Lentithecium fluviatile CBS 122367]|uniref:Uncharacterized protein n=1 Tax=Lentithecium fluviatile CBS 122367 TaxID=1168545 RepID=A0A6G1J821_9PLEO|nr:hypothetical protein K458DRAFT_201326 [Lentithecium fluviatile CBS 122367]
MRPQHSHGSLYILPNVFSFPTTCPHFHGSGVTRAPRHFLVQAFDLISFRWWSFGAGKLVSFDRIPKRGVEARLPLAANQCTDSQNVEKKDSPFEGKMRLRSTQKCTCYRPHIGYSSQSARHTSTAPRRATSHSPWRILFSAWSCASYHIRFPRQSSPQSPIPNLQNKQTRPRSRPRNSRKRPSMQARHVPRVNGHITFVYKSPCHGV